LRRRRRQRKNIRETRGRWRRRRKETKTKRTEGQRSGEEKTMLTELCLKRDISVINGKEIL
jgi:hypothetical protein